MSERTWLSRRYRLASHYGAESPAECPRCSVLSPLTEIEQVTEYTYPNGQIDAEATLPDILSAFRVCPNCRAVFFVGDVL